MIWLFQGDTARLSKKARIILEESAPNVSPAVILELEFLREIKRLNPTVSEIINDLQARIGMRVQDGSFADVLGLAGTHHWTRDPFDRMIVAHADLHNATLLTCDRHIRKHFPNAEW